MTLTVSPDFLERLMLTPPMILLECASVVSKFETVVYPVRWRSSIFRSHGIRPLES